MDSIVCIQMSRDYPCCTSYMATSSSLVEVEVKAEGKTGLVSLMAYRKRLGMNLVPVQVEGAFAQAGGYEGLLDWPLD